MNEAYQAFVGSGLQHGFPLSLELAILRESQRSMPEEPSLKARREIVHGLLRKERPLLKALDMGEGDEGDPGQLAFDGVEAAFDETGPPEAVYCRILAAYRAYADQLAVELFPVRLEAVALEHMARIGQRDADLLIRTGHVMAEVTPTLQVALRGT